jgi:hypothetical protein
LLWRRRIGDQARSGATVRAFCRRHGLQQPAFYWWRRELERRDAEVARRRERNRREAEVAFVPVRVMASSPGPHGGTPEQEPDRDPPMGVADGGAGIEVVLEGGRRIRVNGRVDRQALADVLAVLEGAGVAGEPQGTWATCPRCHAAPEAPAC